MTYKELYEKAVYKFEHNEITLDEFNKMIAPLNQEVREWIPVSEALPEEKGEYLVTYHPRHWDIVENEIKVGLDTFRGKTSWAKKKYQLVIAWCKKPSPYLLESEEEA